MISDAPLLKTVTFSVKLFNVALFNASLVDALFDAGLRDVELF